MKDQYGSKKGETVFYASMNKGKIKGVEKKKNGGLGQKYGPPPKKGPASQGITVKKLSVGGGADMGGEAASGSSGNAGGGGGRDAGMGMGGKSRSSGRDAGMGMGGKSSSSGRDARGGMGGKSSSSRGEGGGDARNIRPSATVQPIKITPASVPIPLLKVKPKMFPFEYKDGGLVRGSGKVLKGRVKKAKIY
jgi:hypothetical protein